MLHRLAVATRDKLDPEVIAVYIDNTSDIELDIFERACRRLEQKAEWFPKVAEIRKCCAEIVNERIRKAQFTYESPFDNAPRLSQERAEYWLAKLKASACGEKP